jgi:hypothetical protein
LKELVLAEALAPDIAGRLDLRASGTCWRKEVTRVDRVSPRDSARERSIANIREHKTEMAVFSSTKGGGDRGSICLNFVGEEPQSIIHGLTVDLGEHEVLEVSVFDTWEMARQHGWRGVEITKLCNYEEC